MISESKIFKDERVLSPEHLPELLPHREHQIKRLANNLKPASQNRRPQNTFIFGSPGIGKTASIKFVFRKFEEFSERVKTIYINTWDYNTSAGILTKLILDLGSFVQRRGISKDEIIERLVETLNKTNKGIIVCLDEVDQLIRRDEKALYDLLRLNQYVKNPIGLVMISNYKDVFINVEPRIRSSLDVEGLEFKPYSLEEMKDILVERTKYAFRVNALEPGVVLLCANHAIKKGGDVRVGLECLRKAARTSEEESSDKIRVDQVKHVLKGIKPSKPRIIEGKLKPIERRILGLLNGKNNVPSMELYGEYVGEFEGISQKSFRKYLVHLEEVGMIRIKQSRRGNRGRKYFISLTKR